MQSLLRSVCRAGSRGASAKLLECATAMPAFAQQPVANQPSVNLLGPLIRPFGALVLRGLSTVGNAEVALEEDDSTSPAVEHPPRIKFKRPDKTARHIMNILNKEAVEKVHTEREIPDVQPGCIIQMRLQVPENKRRESTLKGIVIGRRNAGINTTFRLRRLVAGVGVESVFPLIINIIARAHLTSTMDGDCRFINKMGHSVLTLVLLVLWHIFSLLNT